MKRSYILILIIFFYASACSDDLGINAISRKKKSSQEEEESKSEDPTDKEETTVRRKLGNNGAGLLLKSADQLKSSIAVCVGANKATIREILLTSTTGDEEGLAFLSPAQFKPGENIIDSSRVLFDSIESTERSGTRNGTISLPYLTALSNTANVVGYNCSVAHLDQGTSAELCDCETEELASKMLNRCLSLFEPSVLEGKIEVFRKACSEDKKGAIASLISSFAFAETP